jgi:hypothetical protein
MAGGKRTKENHGDGVRRALHGKTIRLGADYARPCVHRRCFKQDIEAKLHEFIESNFVTRHWVSMDNTFDPISLS